MLRKSLNSYRIFTSLPSTWNRTIIYNHYYPSVIYSTHRIQYQEYHSTSQLQKRNDGSSGGIEKIREFSKKQKRRHKLKLNEIKEKKKHDPLKQQKMEAMKTHMESPETKEFIKEAEES